jgi:hypothetical protein
LVWYSSFSREVYLGVEAHVHKDDVPLVPGVVAAPVRSESASAEAAPTGFKELLVSAPIGWIGPSRGQRFRTARRTVNYSIDTNLVSDIQNDGRRDRHILASDHFRDFCAGAPIDGKSGAIDSTANG